MLRTFVLHLAAAAASAVVMTAALLGSIDSQALAPWAGDDAPARVQPQALETRTTAIGQERAASA
jgi:hypothetical protein